jgi:hypothetical protein
MYRFVCALPHIAAPARLPSCSLVQIFNKSKLQHAFDLTHAWGK